MKDDEQKLIDDLIAQDKALTQEQRDEAWRANKLRMYRDQLKRQLRYLDEEVPAILLALNAHNQYNVARTLWESDMLDIEQKDERDIIRRDSGRCMRCGCALPMPYEDGQDYCPVCDKEINDSITKYAPED